jgi:RNA polymerase sigma-70 factor (ECF subfamily)
VPPENEDRDVIARAVAGDRDAFGALVQKHEGRILSVLTGMLRDHEAAREVAQEVFLKAFRSIGDFKGDASFYTWAYRIAINLAIDRQRSEQRRPLSLVVRPAVGREGDAEPDLVERQQDMHPSADPFESTKDGELRDRVQQAIADLTPDHRAVILLREVEGLSYDEISKVLQCSKGTVMSRLHYARKKLQAELEDFL